jgi:branched-chain amino acid transport system substrate-binding protein
MLRRTAGIACALLLLVLVASCGDTGGDDTESRIIGDTVSVYSSLPLTGPLASISRDIVAAEKLALLEAGGRAGAYSVSFTSLDSADPDTGRWTPALVERNARAAVEDRQTIAYLGELENGASAISLPILNAAGILQVSPRDTFGGLTGPGNRGEPDKYYPSGRRTFARVVPDDAQQARKLLAALEEDGARRLVIADDRALSGTSMGDRVAQLAEQEGIEVVERIRLDADGEVPDNIGRRVRREQADAFFYAGAYSPFAMGVLDAVHAGDPALELYAPDDVAIAPELPAVAGRAASRLELTGVEPPDGAEARRFARSFRDAYGRDPHPQAILGYETMRVVLRAVARAGERADSRRAVTTEALKAIGPPRATFARFRLEGNRLVPVG